MPFFSSTKPKVEQLDLLTPEQKALVKRQNELAYQQYSELYGPGKHVTDSPAYQQGMTALSSMMGEYDPQMAMNAFNQNVADPARQNFQEQTVPGITERFAGGGGLRSGAYSGQLLREGQNLEKGLSGQMSDMLLQDRNYHNQLKSQAISQAQQYYMAPEEEKKNLLGLSGQATGTQVFQNQITPGSPSGFSQFIGPALAAAGTALGGPVGGMIGGMVGGLASGGGGGGTGRSAPLLPSQRSKFSAGGWGG